MKLEKLANFQSELTFLVKWSPGLLGSVYEYLHYSAVHMIN